MNEAAHHLGVLARTDLEPCSPRPGCSGRLPPARGDRALARSPRR